MKMGELDFQRFASAFGEGCVCIGCTINDGNNFYEIPDFCIENNQVVRMTRVETEATRILIDYQEEERE